MPAPSRLHQRREPARRRRQQPHHQPVVKGYHARAVRPRRSLSPTLSPNVERRCAVQAPETVGGAARPAQYGSATTRPDVCKAVIAELPSWFQSRRRLRRPRSARFLYLRPGRGRRDRPSAPLPPQEAPHPRRRPAATTTSASGGSGSARTRHRFGERGKSSATAATSWRPDGCQTAGPTRMACRPATARQREPAPIIMSSPLSRDI